MADFSVKSEGSESLSKMSLDLSMLSSVHVSKACVEERASMIAFKAEQVQGVHRLQALLKAITLIDLTTLSGDDTGANVHNLCIRGSQPLKTSVVEALGLRPQDVHVAAICVYPARVVDAVRSLQRLSASLSLSSTSCGFPGGQSYLSIGLEEMRLALEQGATEIDVVIGRQLVLNQHWQELYLQLTAMKEVCVQYKAELKVILSVGELGSLTNVAKASFVAMMAGADFIKTSTGKESTINATLVVGIVMSRAIRSFHLLTGRRVGLKPAGGLKTARDALQWLVLVKEELGDEWLQPQLFRLGASSLLDDIDKEISNHVRNQ